MNVLAVDGEFYKRACHVTLGSNVTFRFGTKTLHILPDVFYLPFPRPLSPAHAHEEKYGWLARLGQWLNGQAVMPGTMAKYNRLTVQCRAVGRKFKVMRPNRSGVCGKWGESIRDVALYVM